MSLSHPPGLLDPPRAKPANPWPVLLFCMTLPTLMTWVETQWILPTPPEDRAPLTRYLFLFGKLAQFVTPLLFVALTEPHRLRLTRPSGSGMLAGLLFGLVVAAGAFALYFGFLRGGEILGDTAAKMRAWLDKFGFNSVGGFLTFALAISIPHSFLEEYYWRWFVFGYLRRSMPWPAAAAVSGLAFMSHHVLVLAYYVPGHFWSGVVPFSLCVAFGGFAWAWLFQRTGNLYAPWISHLLVDAAIMAIGWDMMMGG